MCDTPQCVRKLIVDTYGYLQVSLSKDHRKVVRKVHGLVLEAFVGSRPQGMECRHLNGDQRDNRLENLAWGTHKENTADTISHGNFNFHPFPVMRGEKHPRAKLTSDQVRQIRKLYETGKYGQWRLAGLFSVSRSVIQKVVTNETYVSEGAV